MVISVEPPTFGEPLPDSVAGRRMRGYMETLAAGGVELGPQDVVVAISSTGRTIDLISSVELAREAGAGVIAITAPSSPLARLASVPIEISVDEDTDVYTPMTTRLAQLAIIDALSVGVAMRQGPELIEKLERTWRSLRTKRVPGFD
jgi:RpiR family carbohydrate utilization transcriptional regulator